MNRLQTRSLNSFGLSVLMLSAFLLSGCGMVPTSMIAEVPTQGPIQQGAEVNVDRGDQFIRVIPRSPRPGMTAGQIVQGFLDASASFDDGHSVAREYLTPDAAKRWVADAQVDVYDGPAVITSQGASVGLTATKAGRIDARGHYGVAEAGTDLRADFMLVKDSGEWRIDRLPPGLILSASDVDRSYRSLAVYFFNPDFTTLVPDPRLLPVLGPGQATTLVRDLLDGPSSWLKPAVRTGFPEGIGLHIESVPIEGGVARVDLDARVLLADGDSRLALSQQLVWSLGQIPQVTAVDIRAGGQPLIIPGSNVPTPIGSWPKVDPSGLPPGSTGYVAQSQAVIQLIGSSQRPVLGSSGVGDVTFVQFAISRESDSIGGIDADGTLWRGSLVRGAPLLKLVEGQAISSPAFGDGTDMWVVNQEGQILSVDRIGRTTPVLVDGLPTGARIKAAVMSRDGTRCALIMEAGSVSSLLVGTIVRSSAGAGWVVSHPIRVEARLSEAISVSWSGANELAVLGSDSAKALQVFDVDLSRGTVIGRGAPEGALSVASAPGLPTLVGAADGYVYQNVGSSWVRRTNGTSPSYPG